MSETMELSKETLETTGSYVKGNLPAWLRELSPEALGQTELKLSQEQLARIDKRFEEQRSDMGSRFDDLHRHTNRWMTVLLIVVGLTGVALTVTHVVG